MSHTNCPACANQPSYINRGLLFLRIFIGGLFIYHGLTKFGAPAEAIQFVGGAAHQLGLTFLSKEIWFEIVKYGEVALGAFLVLGLWTRFSTSLLCIIMLVASNSKGRAFPGAELEIVLAIVLFAMYFTGPGSWSLSGCCDYKAANCDCCKDPNCECGDCLDCAPKTKVETAEIPENKI